jgi:hypothetical protein
MSFTTYAVTAKECIELYLKKMPMAEQQYLLSIEIQWLVFQEESFFALWLPLISSFEYGSSHSIAYL